MSSPTHRPSRFIEGEPLTHAPSVTTQPLFNSIMTEQDEHDQRRRASDPSTASPTSSIGNDAQESLPRISSSSLRGLVGNVRRSIEEDRGNGNGPTHRESTSEKIKGRLRALSTLAAGKGDDRRLSGKV